MANVCIFCSSSDHVADKYKEMGYRLGQMIAQAGHNLVYGGAVGGLMTTVAEGAHDAGGNVTGVVTDHIARHDRQSDVPDSIVTTANLAERKHTVTAAGIMGEHRKPLYLVNPDGFYDWQLQELAHMKSLRFIPAEESYRPHVVGSVEECMEAIAALKTPKGKKAATR